MIELPLNTAPAAEVEPAAHPPQAGPLLRGYLVMLNLAWFAVGGYLALLPEPPGGLLNDQVGHVIIGCVLSVGTMVLVRQPMRRTLLALAIVGLIAGVAVELLQRQLLEGRRAQVTDLAADLAGIAAGVMIVWFLRRVLGRRYTTVTVAVLLTLMLVAAVLGPVRRSPKVQRWLNCRDPGLSQPDGRSRSLTQSTDDTIGPNNVWLDGDGTPVTTTTGPHRRTDPQPIPLVDAIRCSHGFTTLVTVRTADLTQAGPTRIVSVAEGTEYFQQNFHLGQNGNDLSVRLRTQPGGMQQYDVAEVFSQTDTAVVVAARVSDDRLDVFVDGELRASFAVDDDGLDFWSYFPLSAGDEFTDDRTFSGDLSNVLITADLLTDQQLLELAARP